MLLGRWLNKRANEKSFEVHFWSVALTFAIVNSTIDNSKSGGVVMSSIDLVILATVYKGNIIKNLIMDCQSYTKYRPNETTGGIFVSWRRKEELPTGA